MKKPILTRSLLLPLLAVVFAVTGTFANKYQAKFVPGWAKDEGTCQPVDADEECSTANAGPECLTETSEYIFASLPDCETDNPAQILKRPE